MLCQQTSPKRWFANLNMTSYCDNISSNNGHQARNQGGAFVPPEIFKTLHSNFDICRIFQRIKMNFIFNHFKKILLEFFFVLLVNYLLSRFILRLVI